MKTSKTVVINIAPAAFVAGAVVFAFLGCYGLAGFAMFCALMST